MDSDEFTKDCNGIEAQMQARRTPEERLRNVADVFAKLAQEADKDAARVILARTEGRNPEDLDPTKVDIVASGISKIRRGDAWDLATTAIAAGAGVALGYASHRALDVRPFGVPLNAVAGMAGVAAGLGLDSTLTTRNCLFTGGALFAIGSAAYALTHRKDK